MMGCKKHLSHNEGKQQETNKQTWNTLVEKGEQSRNYQKKSKSEIKT